MEIVRYEAVVTGRVQGVYYRDSCRSEAIRLGITGWVRNRADGTVELAAEGPRPAVDQLIAWCRRGPALSRVADVSVREVPVREESGFHVLR